MAPIPRKGGLFCPTKRDGYELDVHFKEPFTRPFLEKMKSCEYSVEASSDSLESEDEFYETTLKSATSLCCKKVFDQCDFVVDLPSEKASCVDLQGKGQWKLGALDTAKTRSPIEHDEFTESPPYEVNKRDFHCDKQESEKPQVSPLVNKTKQKKKKVVPVEVHPVQSGKKAKLGEKAIQKRQSIGKQKRNTHVILCGDTPSHYRDNQTTKTKLVPKRQRKSKKQSYNSPPGNPCVDSGISTGSGYNSSSSSDGGSYSETNSGNAAGGAGGGGGGFYRKGGAGGGHGRDDSENKNPFDVPDVSMEDEEEEDTDGDTKMSSKNSSMDCSGDNAQVHSTPWEVYQFQTLHVQHSAYCTDENCQRGFCHQMKREVLHISTNKCSGHCLRCNKILNLIKLHAKLCKRPCCRVYNCNKLREQKDFIVEQKPLPQGQPVRYCQPVTERYNLDGCVVFNNTGQDVESPFQENMSYQKGERIGHGGNAKVYKVHFPPSSPLSKLKPMVMKEPESHNKMSLDEFNVYRTIGEHPNVIQHYIVTLKGQEGHAIIFMEECGKCYEKGKALAMWDRLRDQIRAYVIDKSLKDLCNEHGPMEDKEALFYWGQLVDSIVYIHSKNIIHKDIKAQNVLLSGRLGNGENFRVKLADFDAARILESEFTKQGLNPQGTKGFAAPEVMDKQPHGRPSDLYSSGGVLMELKGITPKEDRLNSQVEELTKASPRIGQLVSWCMQRDPTLRPTALELQKFLRGFVPAEL